MTEEKGFNERLAIEKAKQELLEDQARDQVTTGAKERAAMSLLLLGCLGISLMVPITALLAGLALRLFRLAAGP